MSSRTATIPIDGIDWSFTIRPLNVEHLRLLSAASELPAISVWEYDAGQYRGIDGYHRWRLSKERGDQKIRAEVCYFPPGAEGVKVFELECIRRNLEHGLPLTREQRDQAILRIWHRWGHAKTRPGGLTLERLGKLFNLTKPRIHQILSAMSRSGDLNRDAESRAGADRSDPEAGRAPRTRSPRPGGFSAFGRFTAATHRLGAILRDRAFMADLLADRDREVVAALREVEGLIAAVLPPSKSGAA